MSAKLSGGSDADVPGYLRPINLLLVFGGGSLGVFARELLMLALPDIARVPIAVLAANLSGAFLLALLLTVLTVLAGKGKGAGAGAGGLPVAAAEAPRHQRIRLLLGTGLLGGFTTYSAVAQAVTVLSLDGEAILALGYALCTLLLGAVSSWLGIALGARLERGAQLRRGSPRAAQHQTPGGDTDV